MKYCGIDLHSNSFTCCFLYEDGSKEKVTYPLTSSTLQDFISTIDMNTSIIVEASTNTFKFAQKIKNHVNDLVIVNTYKMKMIPMANKKTDKIDAEKLAIYLKMCKSSGEELITPVYIPKDDIQDLRSLFVTYDLIKRQVGSIKNRIHALLKQQLCPFTKVYIFGKKSRKKIRNIQELPEVTKFQLNILFDELESKERLQENIADKIKLVGVAYLDEIDVITSMKGMSVMTALAIIADIATVTRFPNAKHFTSYLRSTPKVDSSNETTIIKSTNKCGRKLSIALLSQSLNHFRDANPRLNNWYNKKAPYHKRKGKLRMALCRKVFAEVYHMLDKMEYHYFRDDILHTKKMDEYRIFLFNNNVHVKNLKTA